MGKCNILLGHGCLNDFFFFVCGVEHSLTECNDKMVPE